MNCQRMQTQVKGVVPSIAVDKTDGCLIYLSFASRSSQIVTSKCSEVNISFPNNDTEDAEWVRPLAPSPHYTSPSPLLLNSCSQHC